MVLAHPGLQPRIVRHPTYAAALLSTANESDAMSESDTISSYAAVESINDDTPLPDLSTFLGILKRMRGCEGADGLPGLVRRFGRSNPPAAR
jgi:hypothetical protein